MASFLVDVDWGIHFSGVFAGIGGILVFAGGLGAGLSFYEV